MKKNLTLAFATVALVLVSTAADIGTPGLVILQRRKEGEPLRIATAIPGSPAAKAGIKPGGFLISVNGTNVVNMSLDQALSMVRGNVGSSVTLDLADSTMHHTNKFILKRGKLVQERGKLEVIDQ